METRPCRKNKKGQDYRDLWNRQMTAELID